jgi:thiamine biosynthesis lipoprotein
MAIRCNSKKSYFEKIGIRQFTHSAMNTSFDLFIKNDDSKYSSQAALEIFRIIDLLEQELSKFNPNSEVSRINHLPLNKDFVISENAFFCLKDCLEIFKITNGKFNVTAGSIFDKWKFHEPKIEKSKSHKRYYGFPIILDDDNLSIRLTDSVSLDFGGYAKGYTINKITEILNEWDITCFLVSAGNSTVFAQDALEDLDGWPVSINFEHNKSRIQKELILKDSSLSGSGMEKGKHIIDPIVDKPAVAKAVWVSCNNAALADAFSTVFMLLDQREILSISKKFDLSTLVLTKDNTVISFGYFFGAA